MKNRLRRLPMKKLLQTTLLFALAFCAGRLAAQVVEYNRPPEAVTTSADGNWGLSFPGEGQMPVGNATADYLKQFNAYYAQNTQDKVSRYPGRPEKTQCTRHLFPGWKLFTD